MSDDEKNITPFRLPEESSPASSSESFGERMRRRRSEPVPTGEAIDDGVWRPSSRNLVMMILESPHAAATIARKEGAAARAVDGIEAVLFAGDLSRERNDLGELFSNEPVLADQEVSYEGQPVALIVGTSEAVCRKARDLIKVDYHPAPGILTLEHSLAMKSFHGKARKTERGDVDKMLKNCPNVHAGSLLIGPQRPCSPSQPLVEVIPDNQKGTLTVHCPALLPTLVRAAVAKAARLPESLVKLEAESISGTTAGMELEPVRLAVLATFAAVKCRAAITVRLDSSQAAIIAGQRHTTQASYDVGYTDEGVIKAVHLRLAFDAGHFLTDSGSVLDRALLHADSVYRIPHFRVRGILCKTNNISSSSMPAEGAAQADWAMEEIIQQVAVRTEFSPEVIREKNFYSDTDDVKTTPYGQPIDTAALQRVWKHALQRSNFEQRRREVDRWNLENSSYKRGIAIVPVKFGLGDPRPERNMGMVLIQILADGSIQVRPGVVDLNDGFDFQIKEEVSKRLGIPSHAVRVVCGDFEVVPQATPVLGVDAAGLILRAIEHACDQLTTRLREVALQLFAARGQTEVELEAIQFFDGKIGPHSQKVKPLEFPEVVEGAWRKRVNLMSTGYHRTPNLWWDPDLGAGWPFSAFTYAAAVSEIQVDAFTGEIQILRTDITHEGSPSADQGDRDDAQLFRAFTLGAGWILSEAAPDPDAHTIADFPVEEGVPAFADAPFQWQSDRLRPLAGPTQAPGDPCGEATVLAAASIRAAIWDGLRSLGYQADLDVDLPLPATPPGVLSTFKEIARQISERKKSKAKAVPSEEEKEKEAG